MGLDVTAYREIRRIDCDEYEYPGCDHIHLVPNYDFLAQADGLAEGCYTADAETSYAAGVHRSYGGYGAWRHWLSIEVLGVVPDAVWREPAGYSGKPFVELINFSDCEGVIGPRTSAKLAKDFRDHAQLGAHGVHGETFQKFAAIFAFAADNGAVDFH